MRAAHQRFSASTSGLGICDWGFETDDLEFGAGAGELTTDDVMTALGFSASRSAQPARAIANSRSAPGCRAISASTIASSSGRAAGCEPPFSSGSARLRTKSILKRKRSSCAAVAAAMADAGRSTSNSLAMKRLTCGAIPISRFESASGVRGASGALRYASQSRQNAGSAAATPSQNRSYKEFRRSGSCKSANVYPGTPSGVSAAVI